MRGFFGCKLGGKARKGMGKGRRERGKRRGNDLCALRGRGTQGEIAKEVLLIDGNLLEDGGTGRRGRRKPSEGITEADKGSEPQPTEEEEKEGEKRRADHGSGRRRGVSPLRSARGNTEERGVGKEE